ncbi:hypothetical protein QBC43DRAFT_273514 [Cladorrhinum sp. PSN259]|nr:hypothetical protein QBC43DRAFT_273514 [Cladorrhinum sp. PSN259]
MCYQLVEVYSLCRCCYYQHSIDRCPSYGKSGHPIQIRNILVGYSCSEHGGSYNYGVDTSIKDEIPIGFSNRLKRESNLEKKSPNTVEKKNIPPDAAQSEKKDFTWAKLEPPPTISNANLDNDYNHDSSDSNEESLSSTASISTNSSLYTDAVEEMFHGLLNFRHLRYLWPQVVRISGSHDRSRRNIEAFLGLYANDLQGIASSAVDLAASKFVRRVRRNLSQRITEILHPTYAKVSNPANQDREEDGEDVNLAHDDSFSNVYATAEAFLFDTDPISHLQSNLTAFISLQTPKTVPQYSWEHAHILLGNILSKLWPPQLEERKKRVTWTCKCGRDLYDDFIELTPGALKELENELRYRNSRPPPLLPSLQEVANSGPNSKPQLTQPWTLKERLNWSSIESFFKSIFKSYSLPYHSRQTPQVPGACQPKPLSLNAPDPHTFLLLCVPYFQLAAKLHQPDVCRINSDQELFYLLREKYDRARSHWSRLSKLKKVQAIEFVQFELYSSQLVDLKARPSIPDVKTSQGADYIFDPIPVNYLPPIGSNLLTHLFHHPHHAEPLPLLHRKIPKLKKPFSLTTTPIKGTETGWGLHFVEGTNWNLMFLFGCVGFLTSLVVAIVWAVAKDGDVQGGFAIAGFMIAFGGFMVGYLGSIQQGGDGAK